MTKEPLPDRSRGSGGNALAWTVLVVVLLFVFGIAKCSVEVKPAEAAVRALVEGGGS